MAFTQSDFDLVVPVAARAALRGWQSGEVLHQADLVARTTLAPGQAELVFASLAEAGLALPEENSLRRTGRAVRLFVGDLGGTKLHTAIVDETGAILGERLEPTAAGVHAVIDQIVRLHAELATACAVPASAIGAAAMGVPGSLDPRSGAVGFAPNIQGLDTVDLAAELERRLGHRVRLENDVNLAALGESAAGCAQGLQNFAFVALGTGIGMGLVLDGRLVRGHRGMAGEIALLPVGDPSESGSHAAGDAVLESEIGSSGILATARRLGPTQAVTVEQLFAEARDGVPSARAAIAVTADILFKALLAVRSVVDPELIVLGGSIGLQAEITESLVTRAAHHPYAPAIATSLLGPRAVLAGASLAALAEFIAPPALCNRASNRAARRIVVPS